MTSPPLDPRPLSGPYSGLNLNGAKRFLTRQFKAANLDTPDLDARILLMAATELSAAELIAQGLECLTPTQFNTLQDYAQRRLNGEPVDHILGRREFYGRQFKVIQDVLSPRPDTEILIDITLDYLSSHDISSPDVLDLGTGSGALIITLASERSTLRGVATDISDAALSIARENAKILGVTDRITFLNGNWLEPVTGLFDLIVSNPPYISTADMQDLPPEVARFDPHIALSGGPDGLEAYRRIIAQAARHLKPGGMIALEVGYDQADAVLSLLETHKYTMSACHKDLSGHRRIVSARRYTT